MPSALESLVKVLKLERNRGYDNAAVIGGLGGYGDNWLDRAHTQAKKPEHHILVDELVDLLRAYDHMESAEARHQSVNYMLDRITGRVSAPEEYSARLAEYEERMAQIAPQIAPPIAPQTAPNEESPPSAIHATEEESAVPEKSAKPQPPKREDRNKKKAQPETRREKAPAPPPAQRRGSSRDDDDEADGSSAQEMYEDEVGTPVSPGKLDIPPEVSLARPPRKPRRQMDTQEAADILRGLKAPVEKMKGVGPRMGKSLEALGISTINDLLFNLPRRYDDYTKLLYISKLRPEMVVTVIGTVKDTFVREGRGGRKDYIVQLDDGSGILTMTFFGQGYLVKVLRKGKQIVVSGRTSVFRGRVEMSNPEWEELDREQLHTTGIVPVYGLTEGLGARRMRHLMKEVVDYWADRLPDYVPQAVLERTELADLGWAIQNLHFPQGSDHLYHARRRYVFDELLLLQLAIMANRRDWQSVSSHPLQVEDGWLDEFINSVFPYPLTGAQRRAVNDIREDIARDVPMNRLLQGDVGSGKTAVAVVAMMMAVANGKQAALMAPTGILAEQHYRGISRTLENMPGERKVVIALMTSSLAPSERESIYRGLADGSIDIAIGTHALIQEGVEFRDLGIAIIDEQHRFGVGQRGSLRGKGTNPHLLVMTATPIPRTMALTLYADLDLSIMDEMPPGRTPVDTRVVLPRERERIYSFIETQIKQGRQAFIVHPLVEASDKIDAASAVEAYERLSKVFFRYRVCLLHGKMKPADKDEIMAAFARHEYDLMVTTSVAEVGVDIPNASVIVMEGANRFGLAQLHQFRGRVGRGQHESYCLLIPDDATSETEKLLEVIQSWDDVFNNNYPDSVRRLRAMEMTTDGFKLAEADWKLRGAGDIVGVRQSGRDRLQIPEWMAPDIVALAQQEARTIYAEDKYLEQPEHHVLRERVDMLYHEDSDVS